MAVLRPAKHAFTLLELLVVISIIALLLAILMPALQKTREQSRQVVCATNLHSIGQGFFVYAHDNDDHIAPGDHSVSWMVWAEMPQAYKVVNLGYLMDSGALPLPQSEESVFFCPSMRPRTTSEFSGEVYFDYDTFKNCWRLSAPAPINYMYNTSLDGFGNAVVAGKWAILSHKDRVQDLMRDGSVHTFRDVPTVYDPAIGPERLQNLCQRFGINFPAALLHRWLAAGSIDVIEAKLYLNDPAGWMNAHADSALEETARPTRLSQVAATSLVSDVVGAWETEADEIIPPPG